MRITYYALKPLPVGDEIRQPGDLVPEARDWSTVSGHLMTGDIAPVLVATLPEKTQEMLLEWVLEQDAPAPVEEAEDVSEASKTKRTRQIKARKAEETVDTDSEEAV